MRVLFSAVPEARDRINVTYNVHMFGWDPTDEQLQGLTGIYTETIYFYLEVDVDHELQSLRRWKNEAAQVLMDWDAVFDELGRPGTIGDYIPTAAITEIRRLKQTDDNS